MVAAPLDERSLRAKLESMRYTHPLTSDAAPLVDALVTDLLSARKQLAQLRSESECTADELTATQGQLHPLRRENARLMRENQQLHAEMIRNAESAEAALADARAAAASATKRLADAEFVVAHKKERMDKMESEIQSLRQRCEQGLMQNGVVLPSAHEVRAARKEHMQVSPLTPPPPPPPCPNPPPPPP